MYLLRIFIENFYRKAIFQLLQRFFSSTAAPFPYPKNPFCRPLDVFLVEEVHHFSTDVRHVLPGLQVFGLRSLGIALLQELIKRIRAVCQRDCLGQIFLVSGESEVSTSAHTASFSSGGTSVASIPERRRRKK